ncbi:MAG: hypothetical protein ACXWV0_04525 [Flavisolibacter sp.]
MRVVVNGHIIYALVKNKPVVIEMPTNPSKLVITDGFHITRPFELTYTPKRISYFQAVCVIEDDQLLVGLVITVIVYFMGTTSGTLLLQVLSLGPILYFLFLYYINRKEFIQLRPAS